MTQELLARQISDLPGPILVTGAGGFIGAHLYSTLLEVRGDVFGTTSATYSWRLSALGVHKSIGINLCNSRELDDLLNQLHPKTIFNLAAYGAYSHQEIAESTYQVNLQLVDMLSRWCTEHGTILIQTGSSSEYGANCAAPLETGSTSPNSRYAISKLAATNLLEFLSQTSGLVSSVARLYSVYGALEDPTRLVPTLIQKGLKGELPVFSPQEVTRDFLYIDDAIEGLVAVASHLQENQKFEIFNLASGIATSMIDVSEVARSHFSIKTAAIYADNLRSWDLKNWFGNSLKAKRLLNWSSTTTFLSGLTKTSHWYQQSDNMRLLNADYMDTEILRSSTRFNTAISSVNNDDLLSIIIACYRDEPAIREMHERISKVMAELELEYEVIFVNDCSPDDSGEIIRSISGTDNRVTGINHSRNFGSQAAFLSGMTMARGNACVLMDGDLQDPPEVLSKFVEKWYEGFEVVYGVRIIREASLFMQFAYKSFYRLLSAVSPFYVPRDAGDFSLISRSVMDSMLAFSERDVFLRTSRAYVGHRQCGVDYVRPRRPYGVSTNNMFKNVGWAIKGVMSVSKKPLTYLSLAGLGLSMLTSLALITQILVKVFFPESAPPGVVTTILITMFFGSVNLLGISIVGEYVGRILEEVRGRPRYIARSITKNGNELLSQRIDGISK